MRLRLIADITRGGNRDAASLLARVAALANAQRGADYSTDGSVSRCRGSQIPAGVPHQAAPEASIAEFHRRTWRLVRIEKLDRKGAKLESTA